MELLSKHFREQSQSEYAALKDKQYLRGLFERQLWLMGAYLARMEHYRILVETKKIALSLIADFCGVTTSAVSQWFSGKSVCESKHLLQLEKFPSFVGVSTDDREVAMHQLREQIGWVLQNVVQRPRSRGDRKRKRDYPTFVDLIVLQIAHQASDDHRRELHAQIQKYIQSHPKGDLAKSLEELDPSDIAAVFDSYGEAYRLLTHFLVDQHTGVTDGDSE